MEKCPVYTRKRIITITQSLIHGTTCKIPWLIDFLHVRVVQHVSVYSLYTCAECIVEHTWLLSAGLYTRAERTEWPLPSSFPYICAINIRHDSCPYSSVHMYRMYTMTPPLSSSLHVYVHCIGTLLLKRAFWTNVRNVHHDYSFLPNGTECNLSPCSMPPVV